MVRTGRARIFFLSVCVALCGCSSMQYPDGTPEEEMKLLNMDKKKIYSELKTSEVEKERLQKQIDIATAQNRSLKMAAETLRAENQRIARDNETLKKRLSEIQTDVVPLAAPDSENERNIGRLKIKVLSGNGDLGSAKGVPNKLRGMGHSAQMIDHAPRSDFDSTTIYRAPNLEDEAGRLMFDVGGRQTLKPLSRRTTFDIIVVTGPGE